MVTAEDFLSLPVGRGRYVSDPIPKSTFPALYRALNYFPKGNAVLYSQLDPKTKFDVWALPAPQQEKAVNAMLDQVIAWCGALKTMRK